MLDKILRAGESKAIRRLDRVVSKVSAIGPDYARMDDASLRAQTDVLRSRLAAGETESDLMPEAFALVREAADRVLAKRPYDEQVMGAAALMSGNVAEAKTGEGKSLMATMPSFLAALSGEGVHVVTVNDYLAREQAEQMGRVHQFLGLSVGCLTGEIESPSQRRAQYARDITYGTNHEFGFDYLRDNMATGLSGIVQRGHHFAIVDEIDSILIDDARTPLVISGESGYSITWYPTFAELASHLNPGEHYDVDVTKRTVSIHDSGIAVIEDLLGIDNLYDPENAYLSAFVSTAVQARALFERNRDYVVEGGKVVIVDPNTGRTLEGQQYSDGLHQAIEAKEGLDVQEETVTRASVTLQNYFRMYEHLCGMTGTAYSEAAELYSVYGMGVVPIPTHRPSQRIDAPDRLFASYEQKMEAIIDDVAAMHERGRPVLIGTTSVARSEQVSARLRSVGIEHSVLNAKEHEREGHIIAQAGRPGAVTVATNMAGRGTDILLGGNPEALAEQRLALRGIDPLSNSVAYEREWPIVLEAATEQVAGLREQVVAAGGLFVIGTERHASRRIDDQLIGRAGRQGDPGGSQFYLSPDDEVFTRAPEHVATRFRNAADSARVAPKEVARAIAVVQNAIESQDRASRKDMLRYDDALARQRDVVYRERSQILRGEAGSLIGDFMERIVVRTCESILAAHVITIEQLDAVLDELSSIFPLAVSTRTFIEHYGDIYALTRERIVSDLVSEARYVHSRLGVLDHERTDAILSALDGGWQEHLRDIDVLRQGIGWRSYSGREPFAEFEKDSAALYRAMIESVEVDAVRRVFAGRTVEIDAPAAH